MAEDKKEELDVAKELKDMLSDAFGIQKEMNEASAKKLSLETDALKLKRQQVEATNAAYEQQYEHIKDLLTVEEAVVNRAKNFLDENYGEVFVSEFMNNLSSKYGLETQEFDVPESSNDVFAVGAFAGGTGGLGGGGS